MIFSLIKKGKIRLTLIALFFITLMISFHSCMTFRMNKKEVNEYFQSKNIKGSQHHYKVGKYTIHYVQTGNENKPLVLFVHGSPGSLSAFIDFLADTTLTSQSLAITTDRPGFGFLNQQRKIGGVHFEEPHRFPDAVRFALPLLEKIEGLSVPHRHQHRIIVRG